MKKWYLGFVVLLLTTSAASADPKSGMIRICRYPGLISASDHKSLTIPKGSHFSQAKQGADTVGANVATLDTVQIGSAQSCVTAPAAVTWDSLPIPVNHSDPLHQSFDTGPQFKVSVIGGFN